MELSYDEIASYLKEPQSGRKIAAALKAQREYKLHVQGDMPMYKSWLTEQATDLESEKTKSRKERLCRPKTPRVFSQIKRQYFKIFRAKGNVFSAQFKDKDENKVKQLYDILNDVYEGLSMDEFMQSKWFEAMFTDPNGFMVVERKHEDELKDKNKEELYIEYYPLVEVHDVKIEGAKVEYIILRCEVEKNGQKKDAYRVIDDVSDTIYVKEGDEFMIHITEDGMPDTFNHSGVFSQCPVVQISIDTVYPNCDFYKKNPITEVMPDADDFQRISDDHTISVKLHQHPIFFGYPAMCVTCNGTGEGIQRVEGQDVQGDCSTCNGKRYVAFSKADIAQGYSLPLPDEAVDGGGIPAAAAPCGYVTPDLASLDEQRTELDRQERIIEKGALGIEGVVTRTRERTATEAELDLQPLIDRLASFSANASFVRTFLTSRIGEASFPKQFVEAEYRYGNKYFLRSEVSVMAELETARKSGASSAFLKELMEELYVVRFENNPMAMKRSLFLLDIEPLPAINSTEELIMRAPYISKTDMVIKMNFNDYIERFERENGNILDFGGDDIDARKKITDILTKLKEYAKQTIDEGGAGAEAQQSQAGTPGAMAN